MLPERKAFMQHCLPELYKSESTRIANGMKCGLQYRYISHSLMMDGLLMLIIATYIAHTIYYIDDK